TGLDCVTQIITTNSSLFTLSCTIWNEIDDSTMDSFFDAIHENRLITSLQIEFGFQYRKLSNLAKNWSKCALDASFHLHSKTLLIDLLDGECGLNSLKLGVNVEMWTFKEFLQVKLQNSRLTELNLLAYEDLCILDREDVADICRDFLGGDYEISGIYVDELNEKVYTMLLNDLGNLR
ncbi:hypothetical protein HK098_007717, partial [Nowakowskiella sp. JEL0407]